MTINALTNSLPQKFISISFPRFNLRVLWVSGFLLTAGLVGFYIFQVTEITKAGFLLSTYENNLTRFSQEGKNLEINYSQVNSLVNLETVLLSLNYEKVGQVHYLRIPASTVVAK
ncbi:MAG: hypothetical protein COT59_00440 [Candidatus Nealsonbacteria bacterium CG09_land_8_20_14_0_10_42_14]|uniref:Uncharacterized protein n=1 Tax=Candidatus Nealsonbacteria bacterium CG09_land_8_20_14_0_10_42_14 TaxID=1974707 RepID=A0A2H0WXY6_9BACT|nr:MAG: hypothetical protein COT59_00440 [Candidatus Nealsonbacteria bacterium CG09_land_8_20_14_0_10_42_14]